MPCTGTFKQQCPSEVWEFFGEINLHGYVGALHNQTRVCGTQCQVQCATLIEF